MTERDAFHSTDKKTDTDSDVEAKRTLMLDEHRALLASVGYTRIANRFLLSSLLLITIVYGASSLRQAFAQLTVGVLIAVFWVLHEWTVHRSTERIEDLIARADRNEADSAWMRAYINWHHARWEQARVEALKRFEPVVWLGVLFALILWNALIT